MDNHLVSLITQKNNTFHHIFYEMDMYYNSFIMLQTISAIDERVLPTKQFWINVLLESHATHLRNLIHFFSGKDSINATTVLVDNPRLGIPDADKKTKIIDQAISHLTVERVDSSMDMNNITVRMSELIIGMYPDICDRIRKYLEKLSGDSEIKVQYLLEFSATEIQKHYHELKDVFFLQKLNE